jgi:ABC-type transport system involved in cytochrome c biogenesis permease subunit
MKELSRIFPWLVLGAAALFLLYTMTPLSAPATQMQLHEFGGIPVQDGGRIKPFDSMARTTLMLISGRQTYKDENNTTQPAVKWVLDVIAHNDSALHSKVFRIENEQVLSLLGLRPRSETNFRYALDEFDSPNKMQVLEEKAKAAAGVPERQRDVFQVKVLELAEHVELYIRMMNGSQPRLVPPESPEERDWRTLRQAVAGVHNVEDMRKIAEQEPDLAALNIILSAYQRSNPKLFNEAVAEYRKDVEKRFPAETQRTDTELFFNHFAPFYQCAVLYVVVFLLSCLAWFGWSGTLNRAAFWLAVLTLAVHTGALLGRMYLTSRWFVFVTNLYSSAVFIGWGCVVLCLVLEWLFRNGVGNLVGSVLGALTMLVAHHLAAAGDTLEMMRAVLDTNFWLATHVTCVTTGYTATFVAGFLGLVYIVRGVVTPSLDRGTARALGQMIYGVVCFATLLSFTGTVLGGIWADQSWGRFWGWDPKENGALLIVIWNALILHARWGGMVKQRGMAVLAVVGNMVTGWSWFGTNQLGVGLHAYGFNNTLANGLVLFWGSQLAVIAMGWLLPLKWWASYAALTAPARPIETPPPAPEKPFGKRRGKRSGKKPGDAGFFPGPA